MMAVSQYRAARFETEERMTKQTLMKTSVQLPVGAVNEWPGLTKSEAIRLSVERARYFASLDADEIDSLFNKFRPILDGALESFDYDHFSAIARSLPTIVGDYMAENQSIDWKDPYDDRQSLSPSELYEKLKALTVVGRVRVLDCAVARRAEKDRHPKRVISR